ncbi:peptidoglycan-binding domain-containing protein [Nodosilinea nodulosa]|uniref:peptidoglycan-binding domain-containing protein n=1 Tax=Nodosilinea nodulosa TaxID=416001 RepID=UPI0002EEB03B|nr:peptidoglycan-binding protein [Nodosilinea nodulosa]
MFSAVPFTKQTARGWASLSAWGVVLAIALASGSAIPLARAQTAPETDQPSQPAVPTVSGERIVRPTLQLGSQGESVRELQSMLILLGYYPGQVTGIYQEDTAAAARRFQTAAGITADGIVGPATWSRLFPTPPGEANPPTATPPSTTTPAASTPPASTPSPSTPPATSGSSSTPALPVLRPGMEGDAVRQLQQRLRTKGFYNGAIDGIFGSQTETAVRAAQAANDLTVDGIVGPATWQALN